MDGRKTAGPDTRVRIGAGVVIRDQRGWILLEKRRDCALWGLPGGRIEPGESVREAALREVKEETGLTVGVARLIGVYSEPLGRIVTFPDNGDVVHLVDVVLEATSVSGTPLCSDESEDVQFFDPSALPEKIVPPARMPLADFIRDAAGSVE